MKILIVEDEVLSLLRLKRLLSEAGQNFLLSATSSTEALSVLKKNPDIDAVFIDINLPDRSGIELAYEILTINENIFIVFQTAFENYALEAFRIGAIDYLLKPYTLEDIRRVLGRIEKFRDSKKPIRFMVKNLNEEFKIITPEEIFYIKAELKDSMIRTKKEYIYHPLSISRFEEKLREHGFFRVHKSYLINLNRISKITRTFQSKLIFHFTGIEDTVTSSKEGAKLFREKFGEFPERENKGA